MKLRLMIGLLALCLGACQRGGREPFVAPRLAPGAPSRAWPPQGWAWGLIQIGKRPAVRYGVSAPSSAPLGDIVILPGYGESAEWWFETASDLNREGYRVWVLDGDGQGGSGRYVLPRDLGHTPDFQRDIDGLKALIQTVVRPLPDNPPLVIASGAAGLTALSAVEQGAPAAGLILSAPSEPGTGSDRIPAIAARLGLTTLRASGGSSWTRDARPRTPREKTALGWAIANPDLRMGGPSEGWLHARQKLRTRALAPEALARVTRQVTIITPDASRGLSCEHIAHCLVRPLPARLPYEIEDDAVRAAWIGALIGQLGTDHGV